MRNLNDIEAKAVLLLSEIEMVIKRGQDVPHSIIVLASVLKQAMHNEDARLGKDLIQMADKWRISGAS